MREAARRAGIAFSRWHEIEAGVDQHSGKSFSPGTETLLLMAQAFEVEPAEFIRAGGRDPERLLPQEQWDLLGAFRSLPAEERRAILDEARSRAARNHHDSPPGA